MSFEDYLSNTNPYQDNYKPLDLNKNSYREQTGYGIRNRKPDFKSLHQLKEEIVEPEENDVVNDERIRHDIQKSESDIEYIKHDILYATKDIATSTSKASKMLDDQTRSLEEIQPNLQHISANLEKSETTLDIIRNRLNKFAFWRKREFKEPTSKIINPKKNQSKQPLETLEDFDVKIGGQRISTDDFCNIMEQQINNITQTHLDIKKKINQQMVKLDDIEQQVDTSQKQTNKVNRKINRLLR